MWYLEGTRVIRYTSSTNPATVSVRLPMLKRHLHHLNACGAGHIGIRVTTCLLSITTYITFPLVSAVRVLTPVHTTYKVAALTNELTAGTGEWNRTTAFFVMSKELCH